MQELHSPAEREVGREEQIKSAIIIAHDSFLGMVPGYSKSAWRPVEAIQNKEGSCMAELLYVAGFLLKEGVAQEADLSVMFVRDHGTDQPVGLVGGVAKKYAHTSLLITTGSGALIADFRANRADERPQVQRLSSSFFSDEEISSRMYIGPIADAIVKYSEADARSSSLPTVEGLIQLHQVSDSNWQTDAHQVIFDEEF